MTKFQNSNACDRKFNMNQITLYQDLCVYLNGYHVNVNKKQSEGANELSDYLIDTQFYWPGHSHRFRFLIVKVLLLFVDFY